MGHVAGAAAGAGRVFLLSPANCSGRRATRALAREGSGSIAARLHDDGVPLGELFAYFSGLYFRGKLAYASRFAVSPDPLNPIVATGVHVITPNAGLRDPDTPVDAHAVRAFAGTAVDTANEIYRAPLQRSASALAEATGTCDVVLLGSIATSKYVDVLLEVFAERLCFPVEFVGRGDMSRGGLLLRQVAAGQELTYVPVAGAVRRGTRPPRLEPLRSPR